MKNSVKFLALAVIASACALNANAKTEGNYVGLSLVEHSFGEKFEYYSGKARDLSLSYKYAFNFDNFIVAPELSVLPGLAENMKFMGNFKLNLGYDLTDNFAFLVNIGYNYTNNKKEYLFKNKGALTYGISAKYQLDEHFNLEASLNMRKATTLGFKTLETTTFGISYNF